MRERMAMDANIGILVITLLVSAGCQLPPPDLYTQLCQTSLENQPSAGVYTCENTTFVYVKYNPAGLDTATLSVFTQNGSHILNCGGYIGPGNPLATCRMDNCSLVRKCP